MTSTSDRPAPRPISLARLATAQLASLLALGAVLPSQDPGPEVKTLDKPTPWVSLMSFAFSPDGKYLAGGMDTFRVNDHVTGGDVVLWTLKTGKVRRRLSGHQCPVTALAFTTDGKQLVSFSAEDGEVRVFALKRGKVQRTFVVPKTDPKFRSVPTMLARDGRTLVRFGQETLNLAGKEKHIVGPLEVWDIEEGKIRWQRKRTFAETATISPDGALIAYYAQESNYEIKGSEVHYSTPNSVVRVLRMTDGEEQQAIDVGYMPISALGISPDNATVFALNETFRRFSVADGQRIGEVTPHDGPDDWLQVSGDGRRAAAGNTLAPRVAIWHVGADEATNSTPTLPPGVQNPLHFSSDLRLLACTIEGDPAVLDLSPDGRGKRRRGR